LAALLSPARRHADGRRLAGGLARHLTGIRRSDGSDVQLSIKRGLIFERIAGGMPLESGVTRGCNVF